MPERQAEAGKPGGGEPGEAATAARGNTGMLWPVPVELLAEASRRGVDCRCA